MKNSLLILLAAGCENDSVGDAGSNVITPTNLHRDWGWSSSDQRHRFVAQGVWQRVIHMGTVANTLVNGWMLAPNLTYTSDRVRLELIGEAENLLNSTNAACTAGGCSGAVLTTYNSPIFRQITSAFDSRQIQLGARLRF